MSVPDENLAPASSFGQSFVVEGSRVRYWPATPGQGARFEANNEPDELFLRLREVAVDELPGLMNIMGNLDNWSPIRFADGPIALVNTKLRLFSWQVAPAPQVKTQRDSNPNGRGPDMLIGSPQMLSEYKKLLAADRRYSSSDLTAAPDVPEELKDPKTRELFEEWYRRRSAVIAARNQNILSNRLGEVIKYNPALGLPLIVSSPGGGNYAGIDRAPYRQPRREPVVVSGPRKYFDE